MKTQYVIKQLLTLLIVILVSLESQAQGIQRYGLKAGVQRTAIPVNPSEAADWDLVMKAGIGFQVGAFATFGLTDRLSLQPELLFSAQSFKEVMDVQYVGEDEVTEKVENYKANFLKIPVLLRYGITEKFFAEIGPQADFLVSANIEKADWDVFAGDGKFNFSGTVGAEYLITEQFGVQLRYAHTFGKRNPDGYIWYGDRPTIISLGITYSF